MRKQRIRQVVFGVLLVALVSFGGMGTAAAESSSSTHYKVDNVSFGAGSNLKECSGNQYCAKTSAGDLVVGDAKSNQYSAHFGANTTNQPFLEVIVQGGTTDLGTLDVSKTATASDIVKVRNYLSSGYTIQVTGSSPTNDGHSLTPLATPTSSHAGAEQFGINLVKNTNPAVGADPVQVPDSTFSFGQPATDYSQANLFKYVEGDIVAQSASSTGETDYTLSMIVNISNLTPGGHYEGNFSAVVVPTF